MPPYEPFTCGDDRWTSENVAHNLTVLAPHLAPLQSDPDVGNPLGRVPGDHAAIRRRASTAVEASRIPEVLAGAASANSLG